MTESPILVIDDDESIRMTVADILELEGYPVETACNGAEGLTALEKVNPSVILLDLRMPVLNGWDFARILKERGIRLPILVMTAAHDARRWAQEIGADGVLPKPFGLFDLLDAVQPFVGLS